MGAAIEFRDVCFANAQGRLLLDTISLSVEEGTTAAILGRSGSGKTTLLRTVNRMVLPTSGEILLHDKNVSAFDLIKLRRNMGYVIQETGLFPHFTVERNISLVLEAEGRSRQDCMRRSRAEARQLCKALSAPAFRRSTPACRPGTSFGRRARFSSDG
jgi:osmoprotectant transport system ATP-binding protein